MAFSGQPASAAGWPSAAIDSPGQTGSRGISGSRFSTVIGFALVGATGIVVNQVLLWALVSLGGINYIVGAVIATQGSTAWNFALNELWVFRGRSSGGAWRRYLAFAAINNAALLVRAPLLALLTSGLGIHYLVSNLITLVVLFATRFAVSDRLVWRAATATQDVASPEGTAPADANGSERGSAARLAAAARAAELTGRSTAPSNGFAHLYDLHGFAAVASEVELRELRYFRVQSLPGGADVELRVGVCGSKPHTKIKVTSSPGAVAYEEHLGALGGNFRVDIGDRIRVTVAPLLARSPHVVYTNVVEALLRFVLASRDFALLHSATLIIEGRGVMLSAHTDTGKTHTILRMLREVGGVFLSDDMSIVTPHGRVFAYPKPLTISHHTLAAVDGSIHSFRERAVLRAKSSIHSKKGRGTGMRLAEMNLPIMAINAITQVIVPPPKYFVDRLVPVETGVSTKVEDLFFIARGPRNDAIVDRAEALDTLVENTDDAYGFPPFQHFAPVIALGGEDYLALRRRERSILQRMLEGVTVQRLTRDDFTWADDIPRIARERSVLEGLGTNGHGADGNGANGNGADGNGANGVGRDALSEGVVADDQDSRKAA